ncbi:glutaminase kidney isoform, mitochondrial-like [Thrips palmi]|uniref:glutaminase n=1 Tax=Thrips palmi TaxID=161013 RepID=A0A6P9A761_THRPL|nr:glutaminase kidney isoform, mitochondrial-like [Thrips palmi]
MPVQKSEMRLVGKGVKGTTRLPWGPPGPLGPLGAGQSRRRAHTSCGRRAPFEPWGSNGATFGDTAKDVLFDMFKGPDDTVAIGKFLSSLTALGLRHSDPRLKEMKQRLMEVVTPDDLVLDILDYSPVRDALGALPSDPPACGTAGPAACLNRHEFGRVVESSMPLLSRAFRGRLAIADFDEFCLRLRTIFERCRANEGGEGSSKPLTYALCLEHLGAEVVHRYVGQEPSGRNFNELVLDSNKRPHNPMVNSGAIVLCSLLKDLIYPEMTSAQKFEYTLHFIQRMAGEEKLGFNNAVFVSERDAGDRNYALAFLMREHDCYPRRGRLRVVMDLYFQCCAMETTADSLAVIGATLANGGVCPLTEERVLKGEPVRDALSLMHSCGMYDYSGQFAFKVGLAARPVPEAVPLQPSRWPRPCPSSRLCSALQSAALPRGRRKNTLLATPLLAPLSFVLPSAAGRPWPADQICREKPHAARLSVCLPACLSVAPWEVNPTSPTISTLI